VPVETRRNWIFNLLTRTCINGAFAHASECQAREKKRNEGRYWFCIGLSSAAVIDKQGSVVVNDCIDTVLHQLVELKRTAEFSQMKNYARISVVFDRKYEWYIMNWNFSSFTPNFVV